MVSRIVLFRRYFAWRKHALVPSYPLLPPSTYQVLLHEEIVKITLFQHTPCWYLPVSLIDWHPIWPPQPVHSHRLVRAIARQISLANVSNGPKTFDFCPDGSPDIQWESGKTHIHIIGGTLIKILREGFWEGNPFPTRIDGQTTPAEYIMEHEKVYLNSFCYQRY